MASIVNTKGVDISYWNGDIDLAKVKNAGYNWVMIRCGWGNNSTDNDDSKFAANVAKAEKLGMPWGVYLFSYACSTSDAKSELEHIDRLLKEQKAKGYLPTLPIAIDIEPTDTVKNKGGWTSSNLTNVATIVLDGLKSRGYYPIIYTGYEELAMMNNHIRNDFDCWFAQWSSRPSAYKYNRLGMWQYGGETNYIDSPSISGVGVIDQDIAYKDYPTIIKNGGYNGYKESSNKDVAPTPTPSPTPTPTQSDDDKKIEIPSIKYRVRANGKWWGEITDLTDYAGVEGAPITDVMIRPTKGTVKYRVHICGGSWLPYVTGYDVNNDENGYAGDRKPIDAIEVYYYTPSDVAKSTGYLRAKYRVSPSYTANYFEWQYDNETVNGQDGYAGAFGKTIDRLQITLSK